MKKMKNAMKKSENKQSKIKMMKNVEYEGEEDKKYEGDEDFDEYEENGYEDEEQYIDREE